MKQMAWTCISSAMREIARPPEAVWQKLTDKRLAVLTRVLAVLAFPRMVAPDRIRPVE
jgi:hypothetical protein